MNKTVHKAQYSRNSISKNCEQKHMKALTEGLNQSRIAVEHIIHSRKEEEFLKDNIETVKQQLHHCMISINTEEKRNKVLKELVSVLKGEMSKMQTKQVEIKQKEEAQIDKALKQIQNDIDKISHKKNQQVAKIATLKQNSNQSRSERVVYSNLFKKLESQLKHHEEMYKNELLKVQKTKLGSEVPHVPTQKPQERVISRGNQEEQCLKNKNNLHQGTPKLAKKQNRYQSTFEHNTDEIWLTGVKQQKQPFIHHQLSLNFSISDSKAKNMRASKLGKASSSNTMAKTQKWKLLMEDLIKFRQRVLLETGCQSVQEVKEINEKIGDQNLKILESISLTNDKIQHFEKQLGKVSEQKRFEEEELIKSNSDNHLEDEENTFVSFMNQSIHPLSALDKNKPQHARSDSLKLSLLVDQKDEGDVNLQFNEICGLFLPPQSEANKLSASFLESEQIYREIDYCIEELLFETKSVQGSDQLIRHSEFENRKENHEIESIQLPFRNSSSNTKIKMCNEIKRRDSIDLNVLLGRMQKFTQCQRLIDRNGFFREYKQELNKKSKTRAKRL